jgi:Uma2 family endonuclease
VATTTQPSAEQRLTAEDLLRMPNAGKQYELVRGVLRKMSPPSFRHSEIAGNVYSPLSAYVRANGLGRVGVGDPGFMLQRDPDLILAPDVAFLSNDRLPPGAKAEGFLPGAPDLVVEVVSPGDTADEVEEKIEDWLNMGCRMVVAVNDRRRTVTVHRPGQPPRVLRGDEVFDGEDVVSGFRLPLSEIFA